MIRLKYMSESNAARRAHTKAMKKKAFGSENKARFMRSNTRHHTIPGITPDLYHSNQAEDAAHARKKLLKAKEGQAVADSVIPLTLDTLLESNAARRAKIRHLKSQPGNKARIRAAKISAHQDAEGYAPKWAQDDIAHRNKSKSEDSSFEAQGPNRSNDMHLATIQARAVERRRELGKKKKKAAKPSAAARRDNERTQAFDAYSRGEDGDR